MATYDLPTALIPQMSSFGLQKAGVQFRSPFNGTLQSLDLSAERWACSLTSPPRGTATAGAAEAFLNVMAGGVNKVRTSHPFRPVPLGTLRGSTTLSSTAAIGASTLALADGNLSSHSQSFDHASWAKTNVTVAADQSISPSGTLTADRATETTATGNHYILRAVTVSAATGAITISVDVRSTRGWAWLQLDENIGASTALAYFQVSGSGAVGSTSGGANWSGVSATIRTSVVNGVTWYRCSLTATKTNASTTLGFYIGITTANATTSYAGSTSHYLDVWGAKLERASSPTDFNGSATLLAGDLIGAGSQLFQVSTNCQADEDGAAMSVPLVNRVRVAISSGSAVTWNKPTAEFVCASMLNRSVFRPGYMEGAVLDLEEAF